MDFRQGNELRDIGRNPLVLEKVIIKGTDGAKFPLDGQIMIDECFVRYRIIVCIFQVVGQVLGVGGDIVPGQFFKI